MFKGNLLVTGAAGFIGSHLCERLIRDGFEVTGLDNFNDFYDPRIKQDNIASLAGVPQFRMIRADIRDDDALDKCLTDNDIDLVIHLAAMAGVRLSILDPELYFDVNVTGTLKLLQNCVRRGIKHFVFASSSSVYGNNDHFPFSEADRVDHPISPYAASKKAGELICHNYHHLNQMSIICLRFFTVYGPRQRPDLAVHKFTDLIIQGKPIPCFGDGTTSRDYTYIDDIIAGVVGAIDYVRRHHAYEIVNLGESRMITLSEMLRTIEDVSRHQAIIDRREMQPGDVRKTCADITKARELLGYQPQTDFRSGYARFFEWYRQRRT